MSIKLNDKQKMIYDDLSMPEKIAILLIQLGEEATALIFSHMDVDVITEISGYIATAKNIDKQALINDLQSLPSGNSNEVDVRDWPLDLLANYIVRIHHQYVRDKTLMLLQFLDKIAKVHGDHHPELHEVNRIFQESARDLTSHFVKEENVLFPYIEQLVRAKQSGQPLGEIPFGTVENPVAMMMHEHSVEGDRFEEIVKLTNNYTVPADACNTYRVSFQMLQEFENDLNRHIHLENNILFPKAIALEKELRGK